MPKTIFKPIRQCAALLLPIACAVLTACGGGGDVIEATPLPVLPSLKVALAQPSDRVVNSVGYDMQIQALVEPDPATSVLAQSKLGPNVMLWAGDTKLKGFAEFPAFVAQATKYGNIVHAYVYDELFWSGTGVEIGRHETAALGAAKTTRDAGLKPVVVILPDVILDPAFKVSDINAFDVIGIDVYPSIRPRDASQLGTCKYKDGANLYSSLLHCSVQKLRAQGYTGDIWYLYQGFGLHSLPVAELTAQLKKQRETIAAAADIGAVGLMSWGEFLGAPEIAREPDLYPLAGTPLAALLVP